MKRLIFIMLLILAGLPLMAIDQNSSGDPYLHEDSMGLSLFMGLDSDPDNNRFVNYGINLFYMPISFLAIEPGFNFNVLRSESSSDQMSTFDMSSFSYSYGGRLGAYFIVTASENFYIYLGPRGGYRYYYESDDYNPGAVLGDIVMKEYSWEVGAVLGVKILFTRNLGVFADFAFGISGSISRMVMYNEITGVVTKIRITNTSYGTTCFNFGISYYF